MNGLDVLISPDDAIVAASAVLPTANKRQRRRRLQLSPNSSQYDSGEDSEEALASDIYSSSPDEDFSRFFLQRAGLVKTTSPQFSASPVAVPDAKKWTRRHKGTRSSVESGFASGGASPAPLAGNYEEELLAAPASEEDFRRGLDEAISIDREAEDKDMFPWGREVRRSLSQSDYHV